MLSSRSAAKQSHATESLMGEDVATGGGAAAKLRAKRERDRAAREAAAAAAAAAMHPPSPSSAGPHRRESVASNDSAGRSSSNQGSNSAARIHQRKMMMQQQMSLGLDAEIKAEDQATTPKRRSIFRSSGTASTPDLSTLIRGGRKQSGKQQTAKEAAKHPMPTSSSHQPTSGSLSSHLSTSTSSLTPTRNSSRSHPSPRPGDWEQVPDQRGMATIVEGPQDYGPQRTASMDDKIKRSKPKGMFGRMFGSTSSDKQLHGPLTSSSQISLAARSQVDLSPASQTSPHLQSNSHFPSSPQFPGNPAFTFDASAQQPTNGNSVRPPIPQRPSVPIVPREGRSSIASVHTNDDSAEVILESSPKTSKTHTRNASIASVASSVAAGPSTIVHVTASRTDTYESVPSRSASRKPTAEGAASAAQGQGQPAPAPGAARHAGSSFTDDVTGLLERIGHGEHGALGGRGAAAAAAAAAAGGVAVATHHVAEPESTEHLADAAIYPVTSRPSPYPDHSPTLPARSPESLGPEPLPLPLPPASEPYSSAADIARSPTDTTEQPLPELPVEQAAPESKLPAVPTDDLSDVDNAQTPVREPSIVVASPKSQQGEWSTAAARNGSTVTPVTVSELTASTSQIAIEVTSSPDLSTTNLNDMSEIDEERGRQLASEFIDGDITHIPTDKVAMFLGGPRQVNSAALRYYMQYFDMRAVKLDQAFRDLCAKLHLKAESQEIDRIIEGFSARYYDCNPSTVLGTPGVVHTVTGAMLMLNTDLHIADLQKHMSRHDFVRNSMRAIQESMPAERELTPDFTKNPNDSGSLRNLDPSSANQSTTSIRMRTPSAATTPRNASGSLASPVSDLTSISTQDLRSRATSSTTVNSFTYTKAWEAEAETLLKEIYTNVRNERILLPMASHHPDTDRQSTVSLGGFSINRNQRGAGAVGVMQGAVAGAITGMKRTSRPQSNNNPYNGNAMFSHSDGRLSPTPPSYSNSIGDQYQAFTPALGFAGNLSHTVIKEQEDETHSMRSNPTTVSLEELTDDELALLGAPWAKEGLLSRKIQVEAAGKKPQKKDWKQFFVVIQKGDLHMFVFGQGGSSSMGGGGAVGGGNWMSNAKTSGEYSLMHAMAMALPKPGYSASRPYCFTVTFPSGEISVFQAGTEELVAEWVATCNYWAARKSRQPLVGGVSNMEYGWNRAAHIDDEQHDDHHDRASVRSARTRLGAINRVRNAASNLDKLQVNEWKPPPHATMPSTLDEEAQLESLATYVQSLKEELNQHKSVEEPMTRLYSPGSKNAVRARDNWTAKSRYIHSEIFKYETFVEALRNAIQLRVQRQGEKKLERSLARSNVSLHHEHKRQGGAAGTTPDGVSDSDGNGYVTGEDGRATPAR